MKIYVVTEDSGLGDGLLQRVVLVTADQKEAVDEVTKNEYSYFVEEHDVSLPPENQAV